eukprot:13363567-Alexandrium_andersonii.AAC.1
MVVPRGATLAYGLGGVAPNALASSIQRLYRRPGLPHREQPVRGTGLQNPSAVQCRAGYIGVYIIRAHV